MIEMYCKRTVRPELVEGQSRTVPNEATMHHDVYCYMLRQAQHERFLGYLSSHNGVDLKISKIQTSPVRINNLKLAARRYR